MQDLAKLKYAELRKLAKKAGIKANLKVFNYYCSVNQFNYLSLDFATTQIFIKFVNYHTINR
jgi:hypothetical protein